MRTLPPGRLYLVALLSPVACRGTEIVGTLFTCAIPPPEPRAPISTMLPFTTVEQFPVLALIDMLSSGCTTQALAGPPALTASDEQFTPFCAAMMFPFTTYAAPAVVVGNDGHGRHDPIVFVTGLMGAAYTVARSDKPVVSPPIATNQPAICTSDVNITGTGNCDAAGAVHAPMPPEESGAEYTVRTGVRALLPPPTVYTLVLPMTVTATPPSEAGSTGCVVHAETTPPAAVALYTVLT